MYENDIDFVLERYRELFGFDLSYMGFRTGRLPVYNDGKPCLDRDPDECAGDWTKLGWIRLNPDMPSVMRRYGVDGVSVRDFARSIIAHELAHEVYNNVAGAEFVDGMVRRAREASFTTPYLETVRPDKLYEETFCEWLARLVAGDPADGDSEEAPRFKSFLEYLGEEDIADNEVYLSNMARSFGDKVWFLKFVPKSVDTIVDFGGGEGQFCQFLEARANAAGRSFRYVVVDNNPGFLKNAVKKGFLGFESLDDLKRSGDWNPDTTLLNMSSVIHEVYSYADEDHTVEEFWYALKSCGFKALSIRDMSLGAGSYAEVPRDAVFHVYDKVFRSPRYRDRLESFEDVWGAICSDGSGRGRRLDVKRLIHFLFKYRYVENWEREVRENYLPLSQDRLQDWLTKKLGYRITHKESSRLPFYHRRWIKDFKLNLPDDNGYRRQFAEWLKSITTHIKWFCER